MSSPAARRAAILEAAGIHDVLAKSLGSSNAINVARRPCGTGSLRRPDDVARLRGKSAEEVSTTGLVYLQTKPQWEKAIQGLIILLAVASDALYREGK